MEVFFNSLVTPDHRSYWAGTFLIKMGGWCVHAKKTIRVQAHKNEELSLRDTKYKTVT